MSKALGDEWKDTVSNPGHEQEMPIRHQRVAVEMLMAPNTVEFKTDADGEQIVARECVNLNDKQ